MKYTRIMCLMFGVTLFAMLLAQADIGVTNVVVKPRWPWDGKVDVAYEVLADDPQTNLWVSFSGCDADRNLEVPVRSLTGDGADGRVRPGLRRAVWDVAADAPGASAAAFALTVSVSGSDGLVAYFPFNNSLADATGNGHDATAEGSIGYVSTDKGKAMRVQGGGWAVLPDERFLDGQSNVTVSLWFNSEAQSGWRTACASGDSRAGNDPISVQLDFNARNFFNCSFSDTVTGNGISIGSTDFTFDLNRWYFLAFVLQATQTGSVMKTYVDGELVATSANTSTTTVRYDRPMRTCIGCVDGWDRFPWVGAIDDVRFHARALYQSEIRALRDAGH